MSGDEFEPYDDPSLRGISRYFNNKTIKGRANVAIATYVSIASYFVYRKFFASSKVSASNTNKEVTKSMEDIRKQCFEDFEDEEN